MVLQELGGRISAALRNMSNSAVIDGAVVDDMLKEIGNALIQSDVNVRLVVTLRTNIKKKINLEELAAGINKRKLIQKVVYEELCSLLDSGKPLKALQKGKPNVVMFVGLQGSGKTTTVTKLAHHYKQKGWKPALVCADTFRAGAFDQLKQNATKCRIPYYGSYTETDPVVVARDGVEQFKSEGFDVIIVDTSGRHKQEAELFTEMIEVADTVKPEQIIFVMDGSIGQAAYDQARAFKEAVDVGAVVITKLDGHAKGGGALSAVAATKSPIIFLGVGEHMEDLEPFNTESFVSKLLGRGDIGGLVQKLKEVIPLEDQPQKVEKFMQGQFSLRDMYEQFQNILKLGPMSKVMGMLPGMSELLSKSNMAGLDSNQKLKVYMTIMDSMTDLELDDPKILTVNKASRDSRIIRIARGAGRSIREVNELLEQYKNFQKVMKGMKGMKVGRGGQINPRNLSQMANMMPPGMMKQMGGMQGMQAMLREMESSGGLGGLAKMAGLGGQ